MRLPEWGERLRVRVNTLVAKAIIGRVNDALKTQRLQLTILEGEVESNVEHMQPYGLSFTPPNGSECIALGIGGSRTHTVAICANNPGDRPAESPAGTGGLYTGGEWRVYINEAGVVCLGAKEPADFVALASKTEARLVALESFAANHTHTVTVTGSSTQQSGTTATGLPAIVVGDAVASAKVAAD